LQTFERTSGTGAGPNLTEFEKNHIAAFTGFKHAIAVSTGTQFNLPETEKAANPILSLPIHPGVIEE
jgi:dTDP-4-amino-4,6-dideoxygalactose transaminase